MQILKASFCAVVLATSCLIAVAHDHATGVVRERMEMMEGMAKRMRSIRERIDRKGDRAAIKSDAEAIASQAPHLVHLFPPGSTQKPTDARAPFGSSGRISSAKGTNSKSKAGSSSP